MHGMEHTGTFLGHVIPGAMLALVGLWWFWAILVRVEARRRAVPGEGSSGWEVRAAWVSGEVGFKLLVVPLAALGELWWASWWMTDTSIINYQHATAYLGFSVSGIADLLVRRGRLPRHGAQVALALAFANAGFQFAAHGDQLAVSGSIHAILAWLFGLAALACLLEIAVPRPATSLARAYFTLMIGTWFLHAAWMLYRSGWDLAGPYNVMRVHLFFTWHMFGVVAVGWLIHVVVHRARTLPDPEDGGPGLKIGRTPHATSESS